MFITCDKLVMITTYMISEDSFETSFVEALSELVLYCS